MRFPTALLSPILAALMLIILALTPWERLFRRPEKSETAAKPDDSK